MPRPGGRGWPQTLGLSCLPADTYRVHTESPRRSHSPRLCLALPTPPSLFHTGRWWGPQTRVHQEGQPGHLLDPRRPWR